MLKVMQSLLGKLHSYIYIGRHPHALKSSIKASRNFRFIGLFSALSLVLLSIFAAFPLVYHQDTVEASESFIPSSTSLAITTGKTTASVDLGIISSNGTFAKSASDSLAEFSVTTTNYTGYTITASSSDPSGALVNSESEDTLSSIPTILDEATYSSSTNTTYNGTWGYLPSFYNSNPNTSFIPAPKNTTQTLNTTTCPNGLIGSTCEAALDTYTIGLGARADYTKSTGSYTSTLTLTAVANPVAYAISFADNSGDTISNLPPVQSSTNVPLDQEYVTITSTIPEREGYDLIGWCSEATTSSATVCPTASAVSGGTAILYNPGDHFYLDQTTGNTITLYATWKRSAPSIQNLDPTLCTTTSPLTVIDERDGNEYTVQRLADGKCWMTSDLNLTGGTALYSSDSNVPAGYDNTAYYTLPASSSTGFSSDTTAYVYNTGNITTSQSDCTNTKPCNSYYSWLAATAGNQTNVTGNGVDAPYSICPAGWRLPKSGNQSDASATSTTGYKKGDFYKMILAVKGVTSLPNGYYADPDSTPTFNTTAGPGTIPNFLLAGNYYSSTFYTGGSYGAYWSSSSNSSTNAYYLNFNSSSVYSARNIARSRGFSVRCIMNDTPGDADIHTMQDFSRLSSAEKATVINNMPEEKTYTLKDERDGKSYTIAKLKDGNIWMTSNLNLAGGTVLSADKSDVPTNNYYTLPASSSSGFSSDTTAYVYNTGNETTTQTSAASNSYYSWLAATAGGKDASGTTVTGNGNDTAYSICPKGWRLPKSGNNTDTSTTSATSYKNGDFYKLATAYGANLQSSYIDESATFYNNAGPGTVPNFLMSSGDLNGSITGIGSYGYYWSSTVGYTATNAYWLSIKGVNPQNVYTGNNVNRRNGAPVRCILRDDFEEAGISSMQEFGNLDSSAKENLISSMNMSKSYLLKDTRDNKAYTIAKLKDNNVWMTSNLNLAGGTTLNADTSDVPTNNYYTLPNSSSSGFTSDTTAYVYNTGNETTTQTSSANNSYYSWLAATAGGKDASGNAVTGNGEDTAYSICPKGWRLPKSGNQSDTSATSTTGYKKGDYYKLATAYGANLESSQSQNSAVFYNNAGPGTLPNFLLAGYYDSSTFRYGGTYGHYWSSSSSSSTYAYDSTFSSSDVRSALSNNRRYGFSVRCVLK